MASLDCSFQNISIFIDTITALALVNYLHQEPNIILPVG